MLPWLTRASQTCTTNLASEWSVDQPSMSLNSSLWRRICARQRWLRFNKAAQYCVENVSLGSVNTLFVNSTTSFPPSCQDPPSQSVIPHKRLRTAEWITGLNPVDLLAYRLESKGLWLVEVLAPAFKAFFLPTCCRGIIPAWLDNRASLTTCKVIANVGLWVTVWFQCVNIMSFSCLVERITTSVQFLAEVE
jgi:hypothetical protein